MICSHSEKGRVKFFICYDENLKSAYMMAFCKSTSCRRLCSSFTSFSPFADNGHFPMVEILAESGAIPTTKTEVSLYVLT